MLFRAARLVPLHICAAGMPAVRRSAHGSTSPFPGPGAHPRRGGRPGRDAQNQLIFAQPTMHPAHSPRSQITVRTTRAAVRLIWERPSVNVRQRPVMNVPIVTQLVTRLTRVSPHVAVGTGDAHSITSGQYGVKV